MGSRFLSRRWSTASGGGGQQHTQHRRQQSDLTRKLSRTPGSAGNHASGHHVASWRTAATRQLRRLGGLPETPLKKKEGSDGVKELMATKSGRLVVQEGTESGMGV